MAKNKNNLSNSKYIDEIENIQSMDKERYDEYVRTKLDKAINASNNSQTYTTAQVMEGVDKLLRERGENEK